MRRILIIFNNIIHALIGACGLLFLIFRLIDGAPFSFVAVLIMILAVPLAALGIVAFIWPVFARKVMLGFHFLWLVLSVIWGLYFWYMANTNQIYDWGGLAYIAISIGVYSITLLSLLTISLYTPVWSRINATFRWLISSIANVLPAWITWKSTTVVAVVILLGFGSYEIYLQVMDERRSQAHQLIKADLKKGRNKLAFFHRDWRKKLAEMEVYVAGEITSEQKDHWNTPYRIVHAPPQLRKHNQYSANYQVISAGPDRLFDTEDDIKEGGWLREIVVNNRGTFNNRLRENSPTMERLHQIAEAREFIFPHTRVNASQESFELNEADKWGQNIRVEYAGLENPTVTAYSAGIDGVFNTQDDLFVTRDRVSIEPETPVQQAENLAVDDETRSRRQATLELVKTVATENSRLERVAAGYHSSDDPMVLNQTDAWQRPLELYHYAPERNSVYVVSRGQDGIAGSYDDLVWVASDPNYVELLRRIKKNHLPTRGSSPTTPFFEVARFRNEENSDVQVILPGAADESARDSLRAEFPVFHMASVDGKTCPAEIVDFKIIPPICCPKENLPNIAGRYKVAQGCQVKNWNRAFPVALDYIEYFKADAAQTLAGEALLAALPFGFLFEACEYRRLDTAEFFSCRQGKEYMGNKSWSWHSKPPHRTLLLVEGELVYARANYDPLGLGIDGYSYEDRFPPTFVGHYGYQGKTHYLLASGASVFQHEDGTWRKATQTERQYYGECDCPN